MYIQPNARSFEPYIVRVNKTCDVAAPHFLSSLQFHIIKMSLVFLLITLGLQQHAITVIQIALVFAQRMIDCVLSSVT